MEGTRVSRGGSRLCRTPLETLDSGGAKLIEFKDPGRVLLTYSDRIAAALPQGANQNMLTS